MKQLLSILLVLIFLGCGAALSRWAGDTDRIAQTRFVKYAETMCRMEPNILQTVQRKKCKHQSKIRWAIFEWQECVKREIVPDCGKMPSWRTMPFPDDADPTDDDPHTKKGPN